MKHSATETPMISEKHLDCLLDSLRENSESDAAPLNPPVINLYRLECEKARRQSDRQLKITAAAVIISLLLTTIATAVLLGFVSAHVGQLAQLPVTAALLSLRETAAQPYGRPLCLLTAAFLTVMPLGYLLSTVLLIKKKDALSFLHQDGFIQ